jgi:hypothetical protein
MPSKILFESSSGFFPSIAIRPLVVKNQRIDKSSETLANSPFPKSEIATLSLAINAFWTRFK